MTLVSDPAGEILRQFRYHFNSEDALAAIRLSHGTRSGDKPKHYRPTLEKLAEDRERRKKLTNCGFFSVAGQPYEPLGDIFLDTRDLVYNQLGIERIVKKTPDVTNRLLQWNTQTDMPQSGSGNKTIKPTSGSRFESTRLKEKLNESEKHIVAAKAGRSRTEYLKEYQKQLMAEKHVDDSGSEWRPAIRPRAASRLKSIFLLSSLGKRTARNRTFLGLDEVDLGVIAEMERQKALRRQQEFVEKVQAIYMIVCCVINMKMRNLRTTLPLKTDTLELLQKDIPVQRDTDSAKSMPVVGADSDQGSMDGSQQAQRRSAAGSSRGTRTAKTQQSTNRQFLQPRRTQSARPYKIETWDDILATLTTTGKMRSQVQSAGPRKDVSTIAKSWLSKTYRTTLKRGRDISTLPHWQKIVLLSDDEEEDKAAASAHTDKSTEADRSLEKQLLKLRKKFDRVREKSERHLRQELDRYESDSNDLFYSKFERLDSGPSFDLVKGINFIREEAYDELERRKKENECKCKWLASLEKELSTVFDITVDCEGSEERRETARATLHKLETIDKERLTDILHLKAKLCLLVHSLPPMQVCSKPGSDAFQFSLEHLFDCNPTLFAEWMELRKLPFPVLTAME